MGTSKNKNELEESKKYRDLNWFFKKENIEVNECKKNSIKWRREMEALMRSDGWNRKADRLIAIWMFTVASVN